MAGYETVKEYSIRPDKGKFVVYWSEYSLYSDGCLLDEIDRSFDVSFDTLQECFEWIEREIGI